MRLDVFTSLKWIDDSHLVSNDPNGSLIIWNVKHGPNHKLTLKHSLIKMNKIKGVTCLCCSIGSKTMSDSFIWTISIHRELICTQLNDAHDELFYYSTLASGINVISECPLDLNK